MEKHDKNYTPTVFLNEVQSRGYLHGESKMLYYMTFWPYLEKGKRKRKINLDGKAIIKEPSFLNEKRKMFG